LDGSSVTGGVEVIVLGNRKTGSFLLPKVTGLPESWREFLRAPGDR
jgi:hypothetical protein